jgi:hypothetical protein
VSPTICDTYRSENGYAEARTEGRISKADFEAMCAAIESAATLIGDATEDMGRAIAEERAACAAVASKKTDALTSDCTYRNGMDPETGEQLCARRDGCQCAEIIDAGDTIASAIRNRT